MIRSIGTVLSIIAMRGMQRYIPAAGKGRLRRLSVSAGQWSHRDGAQYQLRHQDCRRCAIRSEQRAACPNLSRFQRPKPRYRISTLEQKQKLADARDLKSTVPGGRMTVHQLLAKNNVTIFFYGHDHLFAGQELDGVIDQNMPQPTTVSSSRPTPKRNMAQQWCYAY